MNTLFLRIYLGALAFLFATFFIVLFIANSIFFSSFLGDDAQKFYNIISLSLADKDQSKWHSEISTFNKLVPEYAFSLLTVDDLKKEEVQRLEQANNKPFVSKNTFGEADLYALTTLPNSPWILKINDNNDSGDTAADRIDDIILILLLILPLSFALYFLVRKLTKPIQHLTKVAKKLGQGDLKVRADSNLVPPMNTLADGFNKMAEQLDETLHEQQILIGAIPHELRSPLGRIRFALDMTRSHTTVEALHKDIEKLDGYVDEMQSVVDEILELNRLQNQDKVEVSKFKLCHSVETLLEQYKQDTSSIKYIIDCDASQIVLGNASLINRAVSNLLSNAHRYAKNTIKVTFKQSENKTILRVEDDGEGIAEALWSEVFTPFSTLNESRNRKESGIGLGLAIVKLIMKKHQGDVTVAKSDLGGARFELCWKKLSH